MKITIEDVNYMAKLSKLSFTEKEAEKLRDEFEDILGHFDVLDQEDLTGVEKYDFKETKSVLRKDEVFTFENKEALFRNARDIRDGALEIPKVIE